ncbi:hypothetical protein PCE1_003825 [Barthelona sp. PCE]
MRYILRSNSKTSKKPLNMFDRSRLNEELRLCGEFGLKSKGEIYRVRYALGKIRQHARNLLTLESDSLIRQFEGAALLRRLHRYGILDESKNELDYVLSLTAKDLLRRRLQSIVQDRSDKSIHEARVDIKKRHYRVGKQLVDVPSYMVRVQNENMIDLAYTSSLTNHKAGRRAKKNKSKQSEEGDEFM